MNDNAQEMQRPRTSTYVFGAIIAILVLALTVVVTLMVGNSTGRSNVAAALPAISDVARPPSNNDEADTEQVQAQTAATFDCPKGFPRVKIDEERANEEFSAIPGGTPTVESFYLGIKEWPQFLAYRAANPNLAKAFKGEVKLWEDGANWEPLVNEDRTCLSDLGYELATKVETAYNMAEADPNGRVPADWRNSGIGRDGPVVNSMGGIPEDKRPAVEFTFPNGAKDWSMVHCGNYPLQGVYNYPQVRFPYRPVYRVPPPPQYVPPVYVPPRPPVPPVPPVPPQPPQPPRPPVPPVPPVPPQPPPPPTVVPQKPYTGFPEPYLPPQIPYTPMPAAPEYAEPVVPDEPVPGPVYTPPAPVAPEWVPPEAGGPAIDSAPPPAPPVDSGTDIVTGDPGYAGSGPPGTPSSGNGENGANSGDPGEFGGF